MTRIISVVNQKGGVGKTTSVINIAAGLALVNNSKVLIIDLDPQGNSSTALGLDKDSFKYSNVYQLLTDDDISASDTILKSNMKNLDIIPSDVNLSAAELELSNEIAREYKLKNKLESILDDYDFILIDCPPSLGLLTINALSSSESCLIPMQSEIFSVEGVTQLLNTISLIRKAINPDLDVLGIFLTMYDSRLNLHNTVKEAVHNHFKGYALRTFIPRSVKLSESFNNGQSIFEYSAKSKGALSYLDLIIEAFGETSELIQYKNKILGISNQEEQELQEEQEELENQKEDLNE